ncbi:hypothetical protein FACS1894153_3500 [Bacteroidia bacterium]|nr:hypothetical protein FACS1894153_3500 [Bacteroidia bacterium]
MHNKVYVTSIKQISAQSTKIKQQTPNKFIINNSIDDIKLNKVFVNNEVYTDVYIQGYSFDGKVGEPKLPAKSMIVEIPMNAIKISVTILYNECYEVMLTNKGFSEQIIPRQAPIRKSKKDIKFIKNNNAYKIDKYDEKTIASAEIIGIAKDKKFAQINIFPIKYNPAENTLKVYNDLEIEVEYTFEGNDDLQGEQSSGEKVFATAPSYAPLPSHSYITYQIISPRKYETTLQPFIQWKTEKGFKVNVDYLDVIGTTETSIANFLKSLYNSSNQPDYVLLIGDVAQLPTFNSKISANNELLEDFVHKTDLYYAEYTGDNLPDVAYGRLSATTDDELSAQIEKIIAMEKLDIPDISFLNKSMLISGWENREDLITLLNNQMQYGTQYYFNDTLGISATWLKSPASENQAQQVKSAINDGTGFVNYTGHGEWNMWFGPLVHVSDANAFTNTDMYPFVIGNCCLTGRFEKAICFAEALLRGNKKGAVGYIGASNSSYFDEDFMWSIGTVPRTYNMQFTYEATGLGAYDCMFHTHSEPFSLWANDAFGIMFRGNMAVNASSISDYYADNKMKQYYWEIYHVFGDPSYRPYLVMPTEISVQKPETINIAVATLELTTIPYAYIGVSMGGILCGGGFADSTGYINLQLDNLEIGMAKLVITANNHIPLIESIEVTSGNQAFLTVKKCELSYKNNISENIIWGDTVLAQITIKNKSPEFNATNVNVSVNSTNNNVKVISNTLPIANINATDSAIITGIKIIANTKNIQEENILFNVSISHSDTVVNNYNLLLKEIVPNIIVNNVDIGVLQETTNSNNDKYLDAGEEAVLSFDITNTSTVSLNNAKIMLFCEESFITIDDEIKNLNLAAGETKRFYFFIAASNAAENWEIYTVKIEINTDTLFKTFDITGNIGNIMEDFEAGLFYQTFWDTITDKNWQIVAPGRNSGFCAKSNKIEDNQIATMSSMWFDCKGGDSISFYFKVSSEKIVGIYGDVLQFVNVKADNTQTILGKWSGEVNWTKVTFPVQEGMQKFMWQYKKDISDKNGEDAAWIDDIKMPLIKNLNVAENKNVYIEDNKFNVFYNDDVIIANINADNRGEVSIFLFDILGRKVANIVNKAAVRYGSNEFYYNAEGLAKGVYLCAYYDGKIIRTKKVVKNK